MTVEVLDYTTAGTDLQKNYRKIQAPLFTAFKRATPEWDWTADLPEEDIELSANTMSIPLDITRQGGTASIPEAGNEAQTYTAPLQWIDLTWINLNQRWFTSLTAKFLQDRNAGGAVRGGIQLKYQAKKAFQALSTEVSRQYYGYSTNYICQTSTNATQSSGTYTLINAYGVSTIDDAAFLARQFAIGDWVGLVRSATIVANAFGQVTAISAANGTIDVTWVGSVDSDANDYVVFANNAISSGAATLAAGTGYNRGVVGRLDAINSDTVHNLSGGTYPEWNAGYTSSTAGRFSAVKIRRGIQEISNQSAQTGGFNVIMADGVERDFFGGNMSAVRYDDPNNMQLDGTYKYKGVKFLHSPNCPPGYVFMDRAGSIAKFSLVPQPDESTGAMFPDGVKAEDRNGLKFSVNFPYAQVNRSRRGQAMWSSQTEQ